MALEIVIGMQWGDEGKGRFVDFLSENAAYVARFAGGDNAGHTIHAGQSVFKLHLLPSGMIYPNTFGILGAGMVINPTVLIKEMNVLREGGIAISPQRLRISHRAHVITPGHQVLDKLNEFHRGSRKIGTTGRGIGPAYTDKVNRSGILFYDFLHPAQLTEKLQHNLAAVNEHIQQIVGFDSLDIDAIVQDYLRMGEILADYIDDVGVLLRGALAKGEKVLAEGAQGALLDIDHGGYPFVTSSSCLAPNALLSLGLGFSNDVKVIGIIKAFQSRVGEGHFPTELFDETSLFLRGDGSKAWDEFGTTTGRPRRVGWLDSVLLKQMIDLNGVNELGLTKLDVLSGLETIKICTAYAGEHKLDPLLDTEDTQPIYTSFDGWQEDLQGMRHWEDLPQAARHYVEAIEALVGVPIRWVSVGPERTQLIIRSQGS